MKPVSTSHVTCNHDLPAEQDKEEDCQDPDDIDPPSQAVVIRAGSLGFNLLLLEGDPLRLLQLVLRQAVSVEGHLGKTKDY